MKPNRPPIILVGGLLSDPAGERYHHAESGLMQYFTFYDGDIRMNSFPSDDIIGQYSSSSWYDILIYYDTSNPDIEKDDIVFYMNGLQLSTVPSSYASSGKLTSVLIGSFYSGISPGLIYLDNLGYWFSP